MTTSPVLLRFVNSPSVTPGPVPLRFGVDLAFAERIPGALAAALPLPASPPLVLSALGTISTEVWTDVGPTVGARHRQQHDGAAGLVTAQHQAQPTRSAALALQQHGAPLAAPLTAAQQSALAFGNGLASSQQSAVPVVAARTLRYAEAIRTQRTATAPAQHGIPLQRLVAAPWAEAIRTRRRAAAPAQHAAPVRAAAATHQQHGRPIARRLHTPAQQMLPLPVGWWQATYPWPEPPLDPNAPSSPVALRFCHLADGTTALVFGCRPHAGPPAQIVVPIRRAYLVLNTTTLVRAADGVPLAPLALSLSIDVDSWTWGFDATIPGAELHLVEPLTAGEPVELIATVNGTAFRVLAERLQRDRRFAASRIRIAGRGRAGMLASPHSPIVTRNNLAARTAQQLLADALTDNGVSIGWSLDWQAADWLVPAGAYAHTGSYIEHAQRIAEAAGAYVQAHRSADTLRILPRYPLLPWEWSAATPDVELPTAPVVRESIEWQTKPAYNRVYVSGTETGGILGQVTRAGTAGELVAPMITDPLITHADAARARGRPVLADTGRQARITIDLPVLPETGILTPGQLVRYTEAGANHLGLVRATRVTAGLPTTRQSIELETHPT